MAHRLLEIPYVRAAMDEAGVPGKARTASRPRIYLGLGLMALSYLICWPLIGFFGILAVNSGSRWLIGIGGPVAYGISHLVFLLGAYLAGIEHAKRLLRQAIRKFILKLQGVSMPSPEQPPWGE